MPVGGGPTVDAAQAREIVDRLGPRWVVPMHYRTPRVSFLEPADAFLETFGHAVVRLDPPAFDTAELPEGPVAVVPAVP
jgi:L-ascorbate metabolism protein UlaG (beta-lactamase superfamily)